MYTQQTATLANQLPDALPVPLTQLEKSAIWREFLCGMRLAIRRCKHGKTGLERVATHNVQLLHRVLETHENYQNALDNIIGGHRQYQRLIQDPQIQCSLYALTAERAVTVNEPKTMLFMIVQGQASLDNHDSLHEGEVVIADRHAPLQLKSTQANTMILEISIPNRESPMHQAA